ncbi:hypothetical protein SFRURICE_002224, partial [Spodoptera frugiperda]
MGPANECYLEITYIVKALVDICNTMDIVGVYIFLEVLKISIISVVICNSFVAIIIQGGEGKQDEPTSELHVILVPSECGQALDADGVHLLPQPTAAPTAPF